MTVDPLPLARWESFYVIVGSSGGALTGLLFVVVALAADRSTSGASQGLGGFVTPSIVHFSNVLFIAAMLAMPRDGVTSLAIVLGAAALLGLVITLHGAARIAKFEKYRPVIEDWIWYGILPGAVYVALLVAAFMLRASPTPALYLVATVSLALLFIGIHNAWDSALFSATYVPKDRSAGS